MSVESKPATEAKIPFFEYIRYTEIKRLIHQVDQHLSRSGRKTLAVISEFPGEGKTFFTAVLAVGFANLLNKRVLIVDTTTQTQGGNLYLDRIFGKDGDAGIDLISTRNKDGVSDESADFRIGPLTDAYRDRYDIILFDTCALKLANKNNIDPVIISKHAGASILVMSGLSIGVDVLKDVRERLDSWEVNLFGTVFNAGPVR